MNDEILRFTKGETYEATPMQSVEVDDNGATDCLAKQFVSEIHVIGEEIWLGRVCVSGHTPEAAEGLRDRLLWALDQPTVPTLWQASYPGTAMDDQESWVDLDNGGEAARLKGEGYGIRALYAKQPLKEV